MTIQLSKPYPHGSRFRCRTRTATGWRWCPSADSPEAATAAAEAAAHPPAGQDPTGQDPTGQDPPAHDPESPPELSNLSRTSDHLDRLGAERAEQPLAGGVRIEGPYQHRGRWRCRIVSASGRSWCPAGKSPAHALKIAEAQAEEEARQGVRSVGECIEQYLQDLGRRGIRAKSVVTFRHMLQRFFAAVLDDALARVTAHRAASLYEQLRQSLGTRTGKVLAVDTHKNMLSAARTFLGWCSDRHWLKDNPLARVKGIGHKRRGKPTLMIDASRTFLLVALREAAAGDDGALAALLAITSGLRAGEVVSRKVSDIDDSGRILHIGDCPEWGWKTKSVSSARPVEIHPYLQPLLRQRAEGKKPTDLIFPSEVGRLQWSSWCNRQVGRLCKLAGVPRVCMHSLRGIAATMHVSSGITTQAVANLLGHEGTAMMVGAYVPQHIIEQAERNRGLRVLLSDLPSEPTAPA